MWCINKDSINSIIYSTQRWDGLTKDEVDKKVKKLFGNSVRHVFRTSRRCTEDYKCNWIEFIVNGDTVVSSSWG